MDSENHQYESKGAKSIIHAKLGGFGLRERERESIKEHDMTRLKPTERDNK